MSFHIKHGKKEWSMIDTLKRIMLPFFLLLIVLIIMLFYSIYSARNLAYRYMKDTTNLYVKQVRNDITMINVELVSFLEKNEDFSALPDQMRPNQSKYYSLISNIKESIQNLRIRYKSKYSFYVYSKKADFLILDSMVYFSSSKKDTLSKELADKLREIVSSEYDRAEWSYVTTEEGSYLFSVFQDKEKVVGCIINLNEFLANFNADNLGYQGIPYCVTRDGTILTSSGYTGDSRLFELIKKTENKSSLLNNNIIYTFSFGRAGKIKMLITSANGVLERIVFLQAAIVIIFLIILAVTVIGGYNYYQRILAPMKQFVENLRNPDEEIMMHDTDNFNILELEMASSQYRKLSREIKSLKIAVYEKELSQKKTELEYIQEQIKPHFFLNCLSIIHAMAEMIHADNIVHIVETLSNYIQYVIKDTFELRVLKDEIEHVNSYVELQKLRYPNTFNFEIIMDESLASCRIPPLVLQTFVENAFKHAVSLDKHIDITLYIDTENFRGEESLYICLSDTGDGFSGKVLEAIHEKKPIIYDGREHLGIRNTIKRMDFIYGDKAGIKLLNMGENGGAVVEIHIPIRR